MAEPGCGFVVSRNCAQRGPTRRLLRLVGMRDRREYTGVKIMPAVVEMHPAQLPLGTRRKCTREDCLVLEAAGRLDLERYELIDG